MRGQGIHYALDIVERHLLEEINSDRGLFSFMELIMRGRDKKWLQLTDKAWEAIHRCLADGTFDYRWSADPLYNCILSGDNLYEGQPETWYVTELNPQEVKEVAAAIKPITKGDMRRRYFAIDPKEYGFPLSEEDFQYTWHWFVPLRAFYQRAAGDERGALFKGELLH